MKWFFIVAVLVVISIHSARATDLGCVSTTFNALSPNDKVCVSVFEDPQVPGIVCHISQARKGGWGQPLGLNEDPSNFSVACRQIGPIDVDLSKLRENEEVFSQKTSIFFKTTRIYRLVDKPRNTLVYVAISTKIINGSPANAISTVPIMHWHANVNCGSRLGLSLIAGGSSQIKLKVKTQGKNPSDSNTRTNCDKNAAQNHS